MFLATVISCKESRKEETNDQANQSKVVVEGKILNAGGQKVFLSRTDFKETSELDNDGNFNLTFESDKAQKYLFNQGEEYLVLFAKPGDSIHLSFDASDFQNSLKFDGNGYHESQYLFEKQDILDRFGAELDTLNSRSTENFVGGLDDFETEFVRKLNSYSTKYTMYGDFVASERATIQYLFATNKLEYALENNISDSSFYSFLSDIEINNDSYLVHGEFIDFLELYTNHRTSEANGLDRLEDHEDFVLEKFRLIPTFFSNPKVVDFTIFQSMNDYVYDHKDGVSNQVRDVFFDMCKDARYKERIENELKKASSILSKGEMIPELSMESLDGTEVSLSDYKGKYVFLDFWATWCVPCLKEIPIIEEWREKSEDRRDKIEIVSISLDDNREKWEAAVAKKEMNGIQLIDDDAFQSKISQVFEISALPRFILIGPEGTVLELNHPKPSSKEGAEAFDTLLRSLE